MINFLFSLRQQFFTLERNVGWKRWACVSMFVSRQKRETKVKSLFLLRPHPPRFLRSNQKMIRVTVIYHRNDNIFQRFFSPLAHPFLAPWRAGSSPISIVSDSRRRGRNFPDVVDFRSMPSSTKCYNYCGLSFCKRLGLFHCKRRLMLP